MRKWLGATLVLLAVGPGTGIALAGVHGSTPVTSRGRATPVAASPRIVIQQFRFSQPVLTVPPGTTVTWINQDEDAHTVTAEDGRFASPGLDQGEQFSYRFSAPGVYVYHCALHPHMTARIIVK
jgi:plastocyanin